ncbi:protein phosphatase 2C-like protein [Kribbella sp. VKM Ac-2569]|uniref:PP2C family serine/threonine-protein phosphatase n=1 Tax=Kribbella sp. VKM Ac-2569 TaxID=2512220 RepID=UPI00102AF8EA|nr:PP2C family serine/threonine-protein phosphatase [Kribbella sp. VKM Ac-2569]RZT17506.1 protein phosphatase 2C-like protein [Kribbella sp. VKM Ac-2569]
MTGPFPPGWLVTGVSVPGGRHAAAAQANQDSWLYRQLADEMFVIAVADGAGSRPRSAVGSRIAVESAFASAVAALSAQERTHRQDWVEFAARWAGACRAVFEQAVTPIAAALSDGISEKLSLDDFACTLLAVLAAPPWYCYITVGDCFAVVCRRPGGAHLVVPPAMAGSRDSTTFLGTPRAATEMLSGVIEDPALSGMALCSDGLIEATLDVSRQADDRLCYLTPSDFGGFFQVFENADRATADLTAGLTSPAYAAASGDDMTMVLAIRR